MQRDDRQDAPRARLRRARREDSAALAAGVGGPAAGRLRALRRLQKTLSADVYVIDEDGRLAGVVAIVYRRSLAEGGLVATVDTLRLLDDGGGDAAGPERLAELADCALARARRRGCVAIDAAPSDPRVAELLRGHGLRDGARQIRASLRLPEGEPQSAHTDIREEPCRDS